VSKICTLFPNVVMLNVVTVNVVAPFFKHPRLKESEWRRI
jgi:hypothetical protein